MDWDKAATLGVPFVIILGLGIWWFRQGWPFISKRIEKADADRKEELKGILTTLEEIRINLRSNTDVTLVILDAVRKQQLHEEREQGRDHQRSEQQRGPRR
jgi:hypothetical protein